MDYKKIGSRLLTAACLVDNGNIVCDVGCDHGKLSLYLIKSGRAKKIIATDIHEKPLQKAIELFKENGVQNQIQTLLADGLQGIKDTEEITHVVIAGLGGQTMAQIIQNADFIKQNKVKILLLPSQGAARVREFLYKNGYKIISERAVQENKKYYTAINAVYANNIKLCTIYDCYIGKSCECKGDDAIGYFKMVLSQILKIKKGQLIEKGICEPQIEEAEKKISLLIQNNNI